MIQIEDPPTALACSACNNPLDWIWRARDRRWYAIVRFPDNPDPTVVKLHTCPLPGVKKHPWKLQVQPPEVWDRGRRKARAVLAARAKARIEKEPS